MMESMSVATRGSAILGLWLSLILTFAPDSPAIAQDDDSPVCVESDPTGTLLLRPVSTTGLPEKGLIVVDPATGHERGRLDLPLVDIAFPTAIPGLALAISGAELFLVDTANLTATKISLNGESAQDLTPNPVQFRGTSGKRFVLLGSPAFDKVLLIDLLQGVATNLTAAVPPPAPDSPVFLSFAAVTPDDAHVVMWDGRHIYVTETMNPEKVRLVDNDAFAFAPDFSPDGSELIYSQSSGPGSGSTLMLESMDGSNKRELRTSRFAMVTLWIPKSRTIFIDERTETGAAAGKVILFDADVGSETELRSYSGSLTSVQLSPDGSAALLGVEKQSIGEWHLADLKTATVSKLPQLSSGHALPGLYGDTRWSLIVPNPESADPLSGPVYRGVDLQTGAISRLHEQTRGTTYDRQPVLSSDGSLSLVFGQDDTMQTVWLLDAPDIQVWKLAESVSVNAQFSPDGCFVAIGLAGEGSWRVDVEGSMAEPAGEPLSAYHQAQFLVWVGA
jgi:hypothetical protein